MEFDADLMQVPEEHISILKQHNVINAMWPIDLLTLLQAATQEEIPPEG